MTEERRQGIVQRFLSWLDRRHFISVRAMQQYAAMWLTWEVSQWAFAYATIATGSGIEVAAIIAAVTAPVCALQGFLFSKYMGAKE